MADINEAKTVVELRDMLLAAAENEFAPLYSGDDVLDPYEGGKVGEALERILEPGTSEHKANTEGPIALVMVLTTEPGRCGLPNEAKAFMEVPRDLAEDLAALPNAITKMAGPRLAEALASVILEDRCPACGGGLGDFGYLPDGGVRNYCLEPRHRR